MNATVARQLARPGSQVERHRARLVSTAVAGTGVFLLAGVAIATIADPRLVERTADGTGLYRIDPVVWTLAPFLGQQGLSRSGDRGVMIGSLLLAIACAVFGVQALRTGSAARERRLAALSLAGATGIQLRRLAVLEGTRAAILGGLLAGPGYLLLWLGLGLALPSGARLLPPPGIEVVVAWPVITLLLAAAGALAAGLAARPALVSPLGLTRRAPRPLAPVELLLPVLALLAVVGGLILAWTDERVWAVFIVLAAGVVFSITGGQWLILLVGRIAVRRELVTTLAGRRLLADVRSPGRVAGVLFATGIATAVLFRIGADELDEAGGPDSVASSSVAAFGTAATAILIAALIATASLAVGATEQVLEGRRATAVLVALAASPRFVQRVVRRQLLLAAVPAAVLGALIGRIAVSDFGTGRMPPPADLVPLLIAVLVAGLTASAGALIAARAVRPAVLESSTPDNLRVP